jgi:A/G-specific adenine glycosylase
VIGELNVLRRRLLAWYDKSRRDLPWRVAKAALPDPYHVLLSETMLQQTQVATVVPYFKRFIGRFPTIGDLAAADEQEILRFWQGLGYYARARNLHRCAREIAYSHGGKVPCDLQTLLSLPGVGRYTAGAIASLAYDVRAPILDGNVTRVLCRLDQITEDPREPAVRERLWARAQELLPRSRAGDFNSALMELGATVCTPRNPTCLFCPVRGHCGAFSAGTQENIPVPKKSRPTPLLERIVLCLRRGNRYLIEQRPAKGRWASMWQFKTFDGAGGSAISAAQVRKWVGLRTSRPIELCTVTHALTHRRYRFDTYVAEVLDGAPSPGSAKGGQTGCGVWVGLGGLGDYPLPKPHLEIAKALIGLR